MGPPESKKRPHSPDKHKDRRGPPREQQREVKARREPTAIETALKGSDWSTTIEDFRHLEGTVHQFNAAPKRDFTIIPSFLEFTEEFNENLEPVLKTVADWETKVEDKYEFLGHRTAVAEAFIRFGNAIHPDNSKFKNPEKPQHAVPMEEDKPAREEQAIELRRPSWARGDTARDTRFGHSRREHEQPRGRDQAGREPVEPIQQARKYPKPVKDFGKRYDWAANGLLGDNVCEDVITRQVRHVSFKPITAWAPNTLDFSEGRVNLGSLNSPAEILERALLTRTPNFVVGQDKLRLVYLPGEAGPRAQPWPSQEARLQRDIQEAEESFQRDLLVDLPYLFRYSVRREAKEAEGPIKVQDLCLKVVTLGEALGHSRKSSQGYPPSLVGLKVPPPGCYLNEEIEWCQEAHPGEQLPAGPKNSPPWFQVEQWASDCNYLGNIFVGLCDCRLGFRGPLVLKRKVLNGICRDKKSK